MSTCVRNFLWRSSVILAVRHFSIPVVEFVRRVLEPLSVIKFLLVKVFLQQDLCREQIIAIKIAGKFLHGARDTVDRHYLFVKIKRNTKRSQSVSAENHIVTTLSVKDLGIYLMQHFLVTELRQHEIVETNLFLTGKRSC